jgi:flagellar motility protein MotE (MotC chaperone)
MVRASTDVRNEHTLMDSRKDPDELTPVDGKDKDYDDVVEEIAQLEETLEDELKKLVGKVGYV